MKDGNFGEIILRAETIPARKEKQNVLFFGIISRDSSD
jgi:hypothetical protein